MKTPQATDILAPRPVHPRPIRNHGLFGASFVHQHMVIDERWTAGSLTDEFQGMANLLDKRLTFKKLENRAYRKGLLRSAHRLRVLCHDGRNKLQNVLYGDNVIAIRNFLINHKDMQRLYQHMPVQMVVDNLDQRTFVLRKERDRLSSRLQQLKAEYELKSLERGQIENRIKYQNVFILDEELQMRDFRKNIENSNTRLRAVKAVNGTYKKIIEVLSHDGIFYEPILRSLCADIDDQANFIKHILYMGSPAIAKFKHLHMEYRKMEEKSRRQAQIDLQTISRMQKSNDQTDQSKDHKEPKLVINMAKHYARETKSMMSLKTELETIESVIKQIKVATLCSHAADIFPRIRSQMENNFKLFKQNNMGQFHTDFLAFKKKLASEQQSILLNNYFEQEEKRLSRIKELKKKIHGEDQLEEQMLLHLKNRAAVFVILRYALWNISAILKYVGRPARVHKIQYPVEYLKLPLLKYEMLTMVSVPPELFEEDVKLILQTIQRKLKTLVTAYDQLIPDSKLPDASVKLNELYDEYHQKFLASMEIDELQETAEDEEDVEDTKITQNIPNRKQLKALSARLVEELSKREE
ncbi:uncharacterized protein LOC142220741 [Haematobia irritans]|uniref:uncharacterized protein LOC142220741 n=1 Tax=Haematobia irritans TaxID=7368 RepID=UPI003F5058A3